MLRARPFKVKTFLLSLQCLDMGHLSPRIKGSDDKDDLSFFYFFNIPSVCPVHLYRLMLRHGSYSFISTLFSYLYVCCNLLRNSVIKCLH
jgi:hypothetical protein